MCFHDYTYILHPSCFCEIWALYVSWITYDHLYDHINILHILYYIIFYYIILHYTILYYILYVLHIYYVLSYKLLLYCYYKYITCYIYYIFNGMHPWRLFRSCYRKLAWVGVDPDWLGSQAISSTHNHRQLCAATQILPFVQCLGFIFLHLVSQLACSTRTKINIKSSINQMVVR